MKWMKKLEKAFKNTDLQYDKYWLYENHYIIALNKNYSDGILRDASALIDLFCLQQLKETGYMLAESTENEFRDSVQCYMYVIKQLEIDFSLFVLLAGETYLSSDGYTYEEEDCEENKLNILMYLINQNYYKVLNILTDSYESNQKLLLTILEAYRIFEEYKHAVEEIETLEDMFNHPEIVRLHEWAEEGFDINAER